MNWDWNAIYLTCFGVGLVLSFLAAFSGGLRLHGAHVHFHSGMRGAAGHAVTGRPAHSSSHVSPINGFTLVAFLCWFGGTGYLLHKANVFGGALVLLFASLSGLAGASLVFWFLASVLMPHEKTLEAADTEMTGVTGRLIGAIPQKGVGEILYSQNGSRRSAAVRSDDGSAIARGTEVIVMRYAKGIAYVRRWDEFEHGLFVDGPARETKESEQKEQP
jgi:hypothetical protein